MFSPTHMVVTVKRASNLIVKSKSDGINDSYAVIEFNKEKYATSCEKSNSPRWNTECSFPLPKGGVFRSSNTVTLSIFNKKHGNFKVVESDDLIGLYSTSLIDLNPSDDREQCRIYELVGKKKDSKKNRGTIEVSFKFIAKDIDPLNQLPKEKKTPKLRGKFFNKKASQSRESISSTNQSGNRSRKRSEDEDSGLGLTNEKRKSFVGKSYENISAMFRNNSLTKNPQSARGSKRNLSVGGFHSSKAMSMEVLNSSNVHRSNSSSSYKKPQNSPLLIDENARRKYTSNISLNSIEEVTTKKKEPKKNSIVIKQPVVVNITTNQPTGRKMSTEVRKLMKKRSSTSGSGDSSLMALTKEQLVEIINSNQDTIKNKNMQIRELEDYIDELLLKVMLLEPRLLDKSCKIKCK